MKKIKVLLLVLTVLALSVFTVACAENSDIENFVSNSNSSNSTQVQVSVSGDSSTEEVSSADLSNDDSASTGPIIPTEPTESLIYELNSDKTGYLVAGISDDTTDVVVPSEYEGLPVIGVKKYAFKDNKKIDLINLPTTVNSIEERAFSGCYIETLVINGKDVRVESHAFDNAWTLKYVILNGNIAYYGDNAFDGAEYIEELHIASIMDLINAEYFPDSYDRPVNLISMANKLKINGEFTTHLEIPSGVTTIPSEAFKGAKSIKKLTLPSSVTIIENYAFLGCPKLNEITLNGSDMVIGEYAFSDLDMLNKVTVNGSVKSFGECAFYNCPIGVKLYINSLEDWLNVEFDYLESNPMHEGGYLYLNGIEVKNLTIPAGIKEIKYSTFTGCLSIQKLVIPEGVEVVGQCSFNECLNMRELNMPSTVNYIDSEAFRKCKINKINIDNISTWFNISFYDATSNPISNNTEIIANGNLLTELTIPESVTSINAYAFNGYKYLKKLIIHENVIQAGSNALSFKGLIECYDLPGLFSYNIAAEMYDDLSTQSKLSTDANGCITYNNGVENYLVGYSGTSGEIIVPEGVTAIREGSFQEDLRIKSIKMSSTVKTVERYSFYKCTAITSIDFANSVDNIGDFTFANCSSLKVVENASNVKNIEASAFQNCSNLTSITLGKDLAEIPNDLFSGDTKLNSINYDGSVQQWELLAKGFQWNYNSVKSVVCNDGTVILK